MPFQQAMDYFGSAVDKIKDVGKHVSRD